MADSGNLFTALPLQAVPDEVAEDLLTRTDLRIERIVSTGQASPAGFWYDQEWGEWVVLLRGAARLRIEDELETRSLLPGDYVNLPAHCRHRVEWTDPDHPTVWLAIHYSKTTTS